MRVVEGVDYAFPPRPNAQLLHAAGKAFAVRYGGPGTADKHLHGDELRQLVGAGLVVVANAEGGTDGMLGGRKVGRDWAQRAEAHFRRLGMPPDRPIYLSVDFDVKWGQWPSVREALRGAGEILGPDRVGIYGGYDAIKWAQAEDAARWFWQTYAWSHGQWATNCHLQQYRNGVKLGGGIVDLCRALVDDYGQWPGQGGPMQLDGLQAVQLHNAEAIAGGIRDLQDPIPHLNDGTREVSTPNALAQAITGLTQQGGAILRAVAAVQAAVDGPGTRPPVLVDPAELVAALKADPVAMGALTDALGEAIAQAFWDRITAAMLQDDVQKPPAP